jgi:hypothetical protein
MKKFLCKVLIPSTGKYEHFNEIDFLTGKTLSKYIQNNDVFGFSKSLQSIIKNNNSEKKTYNVLDMLAILCQLRAYCYGDHIKFESRNDKGELVTYKHNVNRILEFSSIIKDCSDECISHKNFEMLMGLPHNLLPDENYDVISRNIRHIKVGNDKVNFSDISNYEKERILASLDASFSAEIMKYIQKITKILEKISFFEEFDVNPFKNVKLNPYNDSIVQYLSAIFNYNLMNMYELEYILIRRLRFSLQDLGNMTLNEAELHLNLYKKELEMAEEVQKKNSIEK